MANDNDFEWGATVGCEGGPVMVVDLPGFAKWTGSTPYAELRKLNPAKAERFADKMKTLHYWGQFTDQLPDPFCKGGGHQYVHCASEAEARTKLAELVAAVKKKFPNVEVTEGEEQTHFLVPNGSGNGSGNEGMQMWAELAPKSEYDASWQPHTGEVTWEHAFGKSERALFWDIEGGGIASVGVSKSGDEILLLRTWLSGEDETEKEEEAEARALAACSAAKEQPGGEVLISSGRAVVIWSPIAPFQIEGLRGPESLSALGETGAPPSLDTEMIEGVGTVIRVKPGRFAVSHWSTDEDEDEDDQREWSGRWCRLKWVG